MKTVEFDSHTIETPRPLWCSSHVHYRSLLPLLLLALLACRAFGQTHKADSTASTYLFAGIGGFIPLDDSYRVNYSTNFGGLPLELSGGFLFPISESSFVPLTVRYVRRTANFVSDMSIAVLSIEPGYRLFLDPQHEHGRDLRLFGAAEALLGQAFVQGQYDATKDGTATTMMLAGRDYLDLGLGLDLGLTYPLTLTTSIDAMVHVAVYFTSPVLQGGLGDIGGVSLTASYRFGF